ncbi:MAG: hypothetical protein KDD67_18400 [Ignavibacteriae bacterium]|nr:hypothetical protein [Ignavibacteriota bacterium]MCB9214513.1 hypothetical protein [Ignavibacteria bacterium]
MSAVHFHIVFTHAVVVMTILGVLILAWSLLRKNHDIRTLGLVVILAGGLFAIPVYLTGEPAEEVVEEVAGVTHDVIHEHEESAELTFIGLEILAAAALLTLLITARRKSTGQGAAIAVLVLGIIVSVLVARTANLGGQVRHSEIQSGATSETGSGEHSEEEEDHDDEH